MRFRIHGPYPLLRLNGRLRRAAPDRRAFWNGVDQDAPGLSSACGCYVFTIRGRVWYVGLAEKQAFKKEWFTPHKVMLCNDALASVAGKPAILFLAKLTNTGRFARPTKNEYQAVRKLENILIGDAIRRNHRLANIAGTKFLREMVVPGVLNTPRGAGRAYAVQNLKKALGV